MEEVLQKFVNAGIGLVKTVVDDIQNTFDELVKKGAAADDETSKKIKELVNQAMTQIEDARTKIEATVKELSEKVQEVAKDVLPGAKYDELLKKLEELEAAIKQK